MHALAWRHTSPAGGITVIGMRVELVTGAARDRLSLFWTWTIFASPTATVCASMTSSS